MLDTFYEPDGALFVATALTRGPWDDRFQHGGPPSALLARALQREGFFLARLTVSLLRPIPITKLSVEIEDASGRTAQRPVARLLAEGRVVAEAAGLRIRRRPLDVPPTTPPDPWPAPGSLPAFTFPFFRHELGYHRAVDLRIAHGAWGTTPVGFWARPTAALVAGTETSALEQLVILADAQSGMGVPLDPLRFSFVNPDLTVYLERDPVGPWFGFDIRSTVGPQGTGLAQSAVRDRAGLVARSAQALVVDPRNDELV